MIVVPGYRECLQKYEELAIKFYEEGFLVFGHDYGTELFYFSILQSFFLIKKLDRDRHIIVIFCLRIMSLFFLTEKADGFVSIERWVTEVKHHIHEMKDYYRNTFKKDNSPPLFAVGSSLVR